MDFQTEEVTSPKGQRITMAHREGTTDLSTIGATFDLWGRTADEYALNDQPQMSGWAIDVGAHIGTVAIALAVDNHNLRVLAVEALAENCAVIQASIDINGLGDRVTVVNAAADAKSAKKVAIAYNWTTAPNMTDAYVANSRFVGGMLDDPSGEVAYPPGVSLGKLMDDHGIDRVRFLKIDCEGCEWPFLTSPRIGDVQEIIGEFHFGPRLAGIHKLLDKTHVVEDLGGEDTIGLFRAVAR